RERSLVVAGREVVPRRHALDRMPILVHVEDAAPDGHAVQRIDPPLPGRMKGRRPRAVADASEALPAAEIVHAVHCSPHPMCIDSAELRVTDALPRSSIPW